MNNKTLLIIFVGLLAVWGLNKVFSGKSERSFKSELVVLDTTSVDRVLVYPKSDNFEELELKREGDKWIATKGSVSTAALPNVIKGVLETLSKIQTKRVAAKSEEKWSKYEVDEAQGTKMKAMSGSEVLADFIIGRFNFNQQTRTASSYVRLNGEDEVYEVDGFLSMSLGSGFDSYRDKTIAKIDKAQVTEVSVTGDENYTINKVGTQWMLNNETPIDSSMMDGYLTGLQNVAGTAFVDGFDELASAGNLKKTLLVKSNNELEPLAVQVYLETGNPQPLVIKSNRNSDAYFASDSTGVFAKLFMTF